MKIKHVLVLLALSVGITFYFLKCRNTTPEPVSISKVDTVIKYVHVRDTILKRTIIKLPGEVDTLWKDSLIYLADTSYPKLKLQYETLLTKHFAKNIYIDSLPIGKYGSIIVRDTVQFNHLSGRSYISDYKLPTTTIIQPAPKKNKFYFGGGFAVSGTSFSSAQVGVMFKTKSDKIIGTYIGGATGTKFIYGVHYYSKIGK